MWLLCRRRWSRRASAGPPSGSLLRVVGQIGSATNRRRRLMPRTGAPRVCRIFHFQPSWLGANKMPDGSHGLPGVAHTGSLLVLGIQSLSQVLRPPLSPTVFSSPYLPYLRSFRDTKPDLGRPLRSDLPPCTCPLALGGREQSGSVILGLD